MARKIVSACVLALSLWALTPAPTTAQEWSADRPDGHAPAGVLADHALDKGEFYFGYRYYRTDFEGTLVGTTPFFSDDVLDLFTVAPLSQERQSHEVELRLGVTDDVTVAVSMPFVMNHMWNVTTDDEFYRTESNDIGDLSIRFLVDLFRIEQYRMHLMLGTTAPIGENTDRDRTPFSGNGTAVLPFSMQAGTGHWDILGGLGFSTQNEIASLGAQANVTVRSVNNSRGYRLGDRFDFTAWGAYNLSDWMSLSARVLYETVGEIEGSDPDTDGVIDPSANAFAQGGERVYIPFGVNMYFRAGPATGHRIAVEWYYPVHEDLNGPQLSADQSLVASWQVMF